MATLSFDDYLATEDVRTVDVKVPGGLIKLGSISTADALEWLEELNNEATKQFHGLRLLARCIVNPDGTRVTSGLSGVARMEALDKAVVKLAQRDSVVNGVLCRTARILNKFVVDDKDLTPVTDAKNGLSETSTEPLPIVSQPTAAS
jgi:hypothetical protein